MSDLDQLHQGFCAFVEQTRKWSSPPPYDMAAPAFFFPDWQVTKDDPEEETSLPFDEIWLSLTLPKELRDMTNVAADKAQIIVHVAGPLPILRFKVYIVGKTPGRWAILNLDSSGHGTTQIMNFITCAALDSIARTRDPETVEPAALSAINVGRAKSKKGLKPLPRFITIKNTPAADRGEPAGHSGVVMPPHNRRGHWRTYRKSGKRVWVRSCAIHGGSDVGRQYVVKVKG